MSERLILTAASEAFGPSLLALLGSLDLNWPGHPPVRVYDIGLAEGTRARLARQGVEVEVVPPFIPHWRHHFTWKLWCLERAPTRDLLWLDAGLVVLQPLDELFDALERQGYFFSTNHELLDWEASEQACRGCGVSPDFRLGKLTLAGTLMGFRKAGATARIVDEAFRVALTEAHIAATAVSHRHDQAILSLLTYKQLGLVLIADGAVYLGKLSPTQVPGQKVWVHRRALRREDAAHLAAHVGGRGEPYLPQPAHPLPRAMALAELYRVYWCYGCGDHPAAAGHLRAALRGDPTLEEQPVLLARMLHSYGRRLGPFLPGEDVQQAFLRWTATALRALGYDALTTALERSLASVHRVERTLGA